MSNDRIAGKTGSASDRFNVSSDALVRRFKDDRLVVVHLKTKRTHVLNSTAAEIWKLIAAGSSRGEMQQALERMYGVDQNQISNEINQLLEMLTGEELIHLQG
jgi:Coenzyme PQQ synthesis protein D (PqqD).